MGSAAHRADRDMGYFKGYVFNNGHIVMKIGREYAVIEDPRGHILVGRAYPVVEIKRGGKWEELNFEERFMVSSDHRGWHSVGIGFVHRGYVEVRGFLEYYQKGKFREGAPLYPHFLLYFNRSIEHRVIWKYEGIGTNYFEVIDNGSGWTRVPYREGHGRTIIYNGTVHGAKEFEKGQDIVVGWIDGKKRFGLNWERSKFRFRDLRIDAEGEVSMEILSEPAVTEEGNGYTVDVYEPPHPDTGGGGSSDDTDGDGLPDSQEEAGWYIWVCTSGTTWHHILVHSDPNNPDTDGDYVSDEAEYEHGTNPQDEDTDNDELTDYQEIYTYGTYGYTWDSDGDGMGDYYEIYYGEPAGGWQEPNNYNARYAVIIYGDSVSLPKKWYRNLCDSIYEYLLDIGYDAENIFYLGYEDSGRGGVDMNTTIDNITYVFNYLSNKMTSHDFLFLFWVGHGISPYAHSFLIGAYPYVTISFNEIAQLLDTLTAKRMVLVFHPCFSGGIIPYVSGESRVVLTSTKYNEEDGGWGEIFRDGLVGNGDLPNPDGDPNTLDSHGNQDGYVSMDEAYYYAAYRAYNDLSTHQHSLIEDYIGNGRSGSWYEEKSYDPQQETKDGYLAAHTYL